MGVETRFELQEDKIPLIIKDLIVSHLPEDKRSDATQKATRIITNYRGRDLDAASVLMYAAERGRFDEFVGKLEAHFEESIKYVHPQARRHMIVPGAVRAEQFFLSCYKDMGIQPQNN